MNSRPPRSTPHSTLHLTRRDFVRTGAGAAAAMAVPALAASPLFASPRRAAGLRILILGGTSFLGPAVIESALSRGHTITTFNRGITETRKGDRFPDVEKLRGDRDPDKGEGLKSLAGRQWDAVVDTSGYYPRLVKASAELLAPNVKQYVFISSVSAYRDTDKPNSDETAPVAVIEDPTVENMGPGMAYYGALKALCEQAAEAAMPGRVTNIRPGYIVGPGDGTDRYTYWPVRVQQGGEVLAPGAPSDPIQIIDVRDLGQWIIHVIEKNTTGLFNAVGPAETLTIGAALESAVRVSRSDAKLTWVPADFLEANPDPTGQGGYLPIWLPPAGQYAGFHTWSNTRAVKHGLTFRSIDDINRTLIDWWPGEVERRIQSTAQIIQQAKDKGEEPPQMADPKQLRAGLKPEHEKELLQRWRERQRTG